MLATMWGNTVYIVNLDRKVNERMLYEVMVQAGPLLNLHIPKKKKPNYHKGYGFAEYTTEESAVYAVNLFSGLVSLYGKTLGFKIAGTYDISAPVVFNQESHGLFHKCQFTPPISKSCVGYRMPFILPSPHYAVFGHLTSSTNDIKNNYNSRFKSNSSAIGATDNFHLNANQPKPKRRATDRCNSSDAIEIQRTAS